MFAVVIAVVGAALAVAAMVVIARASSVHDRSGVSGWLAFVSGSLGALAVVVPVVESRLAPDGVDQIGRAAPWLLPASIALGLVGLVVAVYALVRGERSWRVWIGLVTGGLVVLFWLVFLIGELVSPH